jgi:hypothetical protein
MPLPVRGLRAAYLVNPPRPECPHQHDQSLATSSHQHQTILSEWQSTASYITAYIKPFCATVWAKELGRGMEGWVWYPRCQEKKVVALNSFTLIWLLPPPSSHCNHAASAVFLFVLAVVLAYQSVLIPMTDMQMIQSNHTFACRPYAFYLSLQRISIDIPTFCVPWFI